MTEVRQPANLAAKLLLVILAAAVPSVAQLRVGENTSMNLNGNVSFGYNGDYSNLTSSDHSMDPSANADLSGYYYAPGFVSFDVQPFFNESLTNSQYQSIFRSSGVNGTASIFSGSNFPGTVSYSRIYNDQGGLSIPGVGNYTTRGDSGNLAVGWGVNLPDLPKVSFQFLDGSNNNSVFGANAPSTFHTDTLGTNVSDTWNGFNLNGGYEYSRVHAVTPEFLVGESPTTSTTSSNSFNVGAGHALPLRGSANVAFNRAMVNSEDSGTSFNGTIDTLTSGAAFQPVRNLDTGVNLQYTNDLSGMLYQSYIVAGAVIPASSLSYATNALDLNAHANYALPKLHLTLIGTADRRDQTVLGSQLSSDTLNEMVTYGNDFLGGFINATSGVTETSVNVSTGSSFLGFFDSVSYQRQFAGWNVTGSFNYTRDTQTVLIGYTTSGQGYSFGLGRKLSSYSFVSLNAVASKSTFNNVAGSGNNTQSYSASWSLKRCSFSGSYGKADGTSILTPTGLSPVTTPTAGSPLAVIFGGKSYSFGASLVPRHGLVLSGTYSKTTSNTAAESAGTSSQNSTAQLNTMLQYKVRQLWITGGYLKLQQGFSITGQPAASYSSFYMGITRWFKFF